MSAPSPASCPRYLFPLLLLLFILGCGRRGHEAPQGGANIPPSKVRLKRRVELAPIVQRKLTSEVETVGYIEAEGETEIAAGVSGVVEEVAFREGDLVHKDKTLLIRIDPRRYSALLAQAEANLKKAEVNVRRMEAVSQKVDAAMRDAEQTLELRKTVLDNIRRAGRAVKIEERQEAQSMLEVSSARVQVARAEKLVTGAEVDAARKEVEAARALRDLAENNFDRSQVLAPYTGLINKRLINSRGTYVEEKTVIATMANISKLRLVGYIPEKAEPLVREMLLREQQTQTAFLVGNALASPWLSVAATSADAAGETPAVFRLKFNVRPVPGVDFDARIFYLSTVGRPDTHQFECKAEIPLRELGDRLLRPGYSAKIRCPLPGRPSSIVFPEESVRASERGFIAFLPRAVTSPEGETEYFAEEVELTLGQRERGWVEVLSASRNNKPVQLRPGDWVVRKGAEALEDNTPLDVPDQGKK